MTGSDNDRLERTVIVTGASRGIGRALCEQLLQRGARVIAMARTRPDLDHPQLQFYPIDFADLATLPARLQQLQPLCSDVEAVICNAGRGQFGSLEEFSPTQIIDLINLNFSSQALVSRTFLPLMKRRQRGDLIFIGSEAALWGGRRGAVYSASKAALRGFAQALRDECARSGVRVCIINPGMVRTDFFETLNFAPGADDSNAILPEEVATAVIQVLNYRQGTVIDEINLSPLKKVLRKVNNT